VRSGGNGLPVWTIPVDRARKGHAAAFPEALAERCILAGCPAGGIILDPFTGIGTAGVVALRPGRRFIGVELSGA
jgi:site-specific DNA-methyltransferase (adenine-specific)